MRQFTRKEILENLNAKIEKKRPLIIGSAGYGIIAQVADRAGIDIIMAYNTGPYRMDGHTSFIGYLPYSDSNADTLWLGQSVLNVVESTPVVAGIGIGDPYRNPQRLINQMMDMGFSGITTVPCSGSYQHGDFRKIIDRLGIGVLAEIELIKWCRQEDIFTIEYAFNPEEVRAFVNAGVDILAVHVGGTTGGLAGAKKVRPMDEALNFSQDMLEIARQENPDVIVVNHGGLFIDAESCGELFKRTDIQGNIGASSIERIPVENEIARVVKEFKSLKLR